MSTASLWMPWMQECMKAVVKMTDADHESAASGKHVVMMRIHVNIMRMQWDAALIHARP
jgi:hypothetical protein